MPGMLSALIQNEKISRSAAIRCSAWLSDLLGGLKMAPTEVKPEYVVFTRPTNVTGEEILITN